MISQGDARTAWISSSGVKTSVVMGGSYPSAAVSPESSEIMAKLGLGILIISQKPWEHVASELEAYRSIYRQVPWAKASGRNLTPCNDLRTLQRRYHPERVSLCGVQWHTRAEEDGGSDALSTLRPSKPA
jgi:hypothetical protein